MKRILYLLLFICLAIALMACGSSSDEETGDGNNATAATATPLVLATPTPKPAPPTPTPPPPAEESSADAPFESEMVLVPAGAFTMGVDGGRPEDSPARSVDLAAFEVDKFEVSNDDFAQFVEATGYVTAAEQDGDQGWLRYAEGKGNHPVVKVTWNDAVAFCEWAGKRLPTEEEWEKAARGNDGRTYPWGEDFAGTFANVKETALRDTTAAGSFPSGASPYGAEDMGGNVWEWTATWFKAYPGNSTENQYYGERFRVTRGGAWFEEPAQVTTFNRNAADPEITANNDLGFRCVRTAQ